MPAPQDKFKRTFWSIDRMLGGQWAVGSGQRAVATDSGGVVVQQ
ncbi:hypothetical protein ACFWFF_04730 [Streptomyces sp. NPDC060223]